LKLAQDVEGRTVATHGPYLTGTAARRRVHALRGEADAVLVGGTTVRHDDPRLDVRHMVTTRQPRPVVLSATADLPEESVVLRPGAVVVTGPDIAEDRADAIRARGVDLVTVPTTPDGMLELGAALSALLDLSILTVLAEPGPRLAGALIRQGLVDTLEVHVAGGAAVSVDAVRPAFPELATLLAGPVGVAQESTLDGDLLVRDVGALTGRTPVEVG
jgi:diaminohydroxyphosphoribosylaminopyrimidine deaminase/5-amino-6-(5-phosphoribosylamino)uracil reductase